MTPPRGPAAPNRLAGGHFEPFRVGIIGAGRVGAVLGAALRAAGHDLTAVSARSPASRRRAQVLLPGVPRRRPADVARGAELLILAVPDDELAGLAAALDSAGALREGQHVVHTSGRHGTTVLAPATLAGAVPIALHPAMTFTGTDVDLDRLPGCTYGVTAPAAAHPVVERLVTALRGTVNWIEEEHRALYHAGLVHGANHLVTLVSQSMDLLRAAGAPDPAATLRPLLEAALDNALHHGNAALTGPIARGDVRTVRAHLRRLSASPPHTREAYVVMARATVHHAVADGRLSRDRATAVLGLLDSSPSRARV